MAGEHETVDGDVEHEIDDSVPDGTEPAGTVPDDTGPDDALTRFDALLREEPDAGEPRPVVDPRIRRRRRRRALWIVAAILVAVLATGGGYVGWALTAPLPDAVESLRTPSVPTIDPADIALPTDGAHAIAISGADDYLGPDAGAVWATSGLDDERPMASITKLITALVVLDAYPIEEAGTGPTLTFDRADHALYDEYYVQGATIAEMPIGSSMTLRSALAVMLVPSASNYAEVIATWAFGSVGGFAGAADRWLDAHGLHATTVVEPTGLDARNTSTPGDLLALGRLAAAHPIVAEITALPAVVVGGESYVSTNNLLGVSGITGLKTGTLEESGSNLLYTATFEVGLPEPLEVVGVLLGAFSRQQVDAAVPALLESIRMGFARVDVAAYGTPVGTYTTAWGDEVNLVLGAGGSLFVWSDAAITVEMETTTPVRWAEGEIVGSVTYTAGTDSVRVPVILEESVTVPDEWWRLTHPELLG